ncbi:Ig-like domain-containing protein [Luteolibacter marinus]|uniref:Ig-like domain-containing protein n=1 Tax=Luteolibacter marinus TaxID=2776705 RepID=UPI001866AAE8|nr:Ig-like domain-containing protein [Luteolibacter marinus]
MKNTPACLATLLAISAPAQVFGLEHGSLEVVQLNTTNNNQDSPEPAVAVTIKPGATPAFAVRGYNRGDTDMAFSATPATDPQNGVMITSVTQNGRNNASGGGPDGISYATSHADFGATGFYIPVQCTSGGVEGNGGEYNMNVAAAWFPYAEGWLGGHARNAANGGALTLLESSSGIHLGSEFIDEAAGGISTLDLTALDSHGVPATSANGVLLVTGGKNEDNFAMSRDNADGTFTLSVMDNGSTNPTGYEQDPVAFVYVPTVAAGRGHVKALGRIQSDGSKETGSDNFTVTKQGTGEWLLVIAGEDDSTGTLIVSAEGGLPPEATTPNNTNNVVSYEWNPGLGGWLIQSRNLPDVALEDGATADEDMFSFAFLTAEPALALTSPAHGSLEQAGTQLTLSAAATGATPAAIQQVEFFVNGVTAGVDTTAPYESSYTLPLPGYYSFEAFATLDGGATVSTPQARVLVEADVDAPALPGYTVGIIDGGDPESTVDTPPALTAGWEVVTGTPSPLAFSDLGTASGEPAIRINGAPVPFDSGILFATNHAGDNYADTSTWGPIDNNLIPRNDGGNYALAVEDNAQGGGDPATSKESSQLALGFFPYADGWTGAHVAADATVSASSNLPAGIEVTNTAEGSYAITGLPLAGNLIAIATGSGSDNMMSIGQSGVSWLVNSRDNSQNLENGDFAFLFVPQASTQVLSGAVANDGTLTPLNVGLGAIGATVTVVANTYEIQFGDGTQVNPSTATLFLTGDFNAGNGFDNIYSYHANGNKFVVFSHDLPGLSGNAQAGGFRFLATPLAPAVLNGDEVEVAVTDTEAREGSDDRTLEFKFTRFADIGSPLTIQYQVDGNAINGTDYESLPGSVTFAAGQQTVTVTVTVIDDSDFELDETVGLTVLPGSGYSVGLNASASGLIRNAASIVPVVEVSFQDGSDGYDGTFTKFVGKSTPRRQVPALDEFGNPVLDGGGNPVLVDEYDPPVYTETLGSSVAQAYLDGFPGHKGATPADDSPDVNAMVRFDNLFGNGPGQVPVGATIAKAELKLTTANGGNSQSGGPYVVDQLLIPVDETTTYADLDFGEGFEGVRGASTGIPLAAFGAMAKQQVETGDVTAIVRAWAEALAADPGSNPNYGFAVFTGGTTDGWEFCTEGNANVALRPKLVIRYVEAPTSTYTFSADQSARLIGQAATEDGSTIGVQFIDQAAGATQEALMRFPVTFGGEGIPLDEEIVKAELVLVTGSPLFGGSANAQSPGPVAVHRVLVPWDVTTEFGFYGPQVGQDIDPAISRVSGMGQGSTAYLDLTAAAQAWRAGEANHGVNLKPETTDGWQFFWPGSALAGTTPQLRIVTAKLGSGEPTAFDLWAESHGGPGAQQGSDTDRDGIPALVEYALGLDLAAVDRLPELAVAGGTASLQFTKGADAKGDAAVSYQIKSSTNLIDWETVTEAVDGPDDISMSIPLGAGKKFFRLVVTYQP